MDFRRWNEYIEYHLAHEDLKKPDVGYVVFDEDLSDQEKLYLCGRIINWISQGKYKNVR